MKNYKNLVEGSRNLPFSMLPEEGSAKAPLDPLQKPPGRGRVSSCLVYRPLRSSKEEAYAVPVLRVLIQSLGIPAAIFRDSS